MSKPRIVAAVTAYNEQASIAGVLTVLTQCPSISIVQVVDDGSTDSTAEIAKRYPVQLISLPQRVPVGEAIMHHLTTLQDDDFIFWCDADLNNLSVEHIESTIANFFQKQVSQSINVKRIPIPILRDIYGIREWLIFMFGSISGERMIPKKLFADAIQICKQSGCMHLMKGYGIVMFLNWYCRKHGNGTCMSYSPEIGHAQKYEKWGKQASREMISEWIQFIHVWICIRILAFRGRFSQANTTCTGSHISTDPR